MAASRGEDWGDANPLRRCLLYEERALLSTSASTSTTSRQTELQQHRDSGSVRNEGVESRVLVPCARRASGPCLLAAYSLDGAHNAGRRVVSEQGRSRMSRKKAGLVLDSAPLKCLEVPRAADGRRGSGEAARRKIRRGSSQRSHDVILLVNRELTPFPSCFFFHYAGPTAQPIDRAIDIAV